MAPSAISTPTGVQETSWAQSSGILSVHSLHVSPPEAEHHTSGTTSTTSSPSPVMSSSNSRTSSITSENVEEVHDLICIGFGPASLAIAIALHDSQQASKAPSPKTLFLERQPQFAWHSGMQLPGAKMQISFLKDLATPRDPRSQFTFLNYLFSVGRLNHFINLSTFLPTRVEYEDYLRWCAGFFEREGLVRYGTDVVDVSIGDKGSDGKVKSWIVRSRASNGGLTERRTKRVVIAVGGKPAIPGNLRGLKGVAHSSQFANSIKGIEERRLRDVEKPLRFAVVGSGQSAAEIFNDIWERFPDAHVRLIIKGASLRPSDDSPFVNEIFDPDRVDSIYAQHPIERTAAITLDRATNYGVVRLSLLEHLYEKLYMQRLANPKESEWRCQIIPNRAVISASQSLKSSSLKLKLGVPEEKKDWVEEYIEEELEVDYVFTATGYKRNVHEDMLKGLNELLPSGKKDGKIPVSRDYRALYDENKVDFAEAGIWLQGCNESTHGLSDTLLSILAVRGGELVTSMFGDKS